MPCPESEGYTSLTGQHNADVGHAGIELTTPSSAAVALSSGMFDEHLDLLVTALHAQLATVATYHALLPTTSAQFGKITTSAVKRLGNAIDEFRCDLRSAEPSYDVPAPMHAEDWIDSNGSKSCAVTFRSDSQLQLLQSDHAVTPTGQFTDESFPLATTFNFVEWHQLVGTSDIDDADDELAITMVAWRFYFDCGCLLLVACDGLILPFEIAFLESEIHGSLGQRLWLTLLTTFFTADILLNFLVPDHANLAAQTHTRQDSCGCRWHNAKEYIKRWFLLDLVSTLPWWWLFHFFRPSIHRGLRTGTTTSAGRLFMAFRLLRLTRLFRFLKVRRLTRAFEENISAEHFVYIFKLFRVLVSVLLICHINACIWWTIGKPRTLFTELFLSAERQNIWADRPHWTTAMRSGADSELWRWLDMPVTDVYIFGLYWTLGIMRTMPAEVTPTNDVERIYASCFMCFALAVFAINLTTVTQISLKLFDSSFADEMAALREHLRACTASRNLSANIQQFLAHLHRQGALQERAYNKMLKLLPPTLDRRLQSAQQTPYLLRLPSLKEADNKFLLYIVGAAEFQDLAPGTVLCRRQYQHTAAWVLVNGVLEDVEGYEVVARQEDIVGEECLEGQHIVIATRTVRTTGCCRLLRVDRRRYLEGRDVYTTSARTQFQLRTTSCIP